jgi:putative membrane protein
MLVGWLVSGIRIADGKAALIAALVLGAANIFVRPVIVLLTLPLTILTLGLFLIVVNAGMLMLTSGLVAGFKVDGFKSALLGSIVLSLLNLGVNMVFGL